MMKNLNKYILLAGCCVGGFISADVKAMTYDCRIINEDCYSMGYTDTATSCPGGYISCPFNIMAATCDREADSGDYKFTRESATTKGWSVVSAALGRFVVGAGTTSYCGLSSGGNTAFSTFKSHTHGKGTAGSKGAETKAVDKVSGDGVGEGDKNVCTYSAASSYIGVTQDSVKTLYYNGSGSTTDTYPIHKVVKFYAYASPISSYKGAASIPSSPPTCQDLGYVDSTDQCPGTYVKCPFDSSYVMCDMQAEAGEIKFSLQSENHDGWLLANGGTLSGAYAKSELANLLASTTLPDYRGVFLKIGDELDDNITRDALAEHSHEMAWYIHYPTNKASKCDSGDKTAYTAIEYGVEIQSVSDMTHLSGYHTDYYPAENLSETAPPHYIANVFIYSGKLNVGSGCMYSNTCSGTYPYSTESSALTACGTGNVSSCTACSITKYKCTQDCSSYTLASCPSGYNCSSCGGKYKTNGCKSGYTYYSNETFSCGFGYTMELDGCQSRSDYCYAHCCAEENNCNAYGGSYCDDYDNCINNCM